MFARKSDNWIRLIGLFKLGKGLLFLLLGLGFATFIQNDTAEQVIGWMRLLSLRQENRYIGNLLSWAIGYDRRGLGALEASILVYALLLLTESGGLLLLKRWAEYLTVFTTACFIPLEVWSDVRRFGLTKTALLVLNILALWYLSVRLWSRGAERRPSKS
jgi:uncharacterized membrane protein (DUF2068 family)